MTIKCRSLHFLLLSVGLCLQSPVSAQGLPPTNMGKFVHQPGDNQYQPQAQVTRHGNSGYLDVTGCEDHRAEARAKAAAAQQNVAPSYILAPPPKGPDISIEPIPCEEPIPPSGFPPLKALDLPVQIGALSNSGRGAWSDRGKSSGGGHSVPVESHQHYNHVPVGAFLPQNNSQTLEVGEIEYRAGDGVDGNSSGFGGAQSSRTQSASSSPSNPVVKSGYRVATPPPMVKEDRYDVNVNGTTGKGANHAAVPGGAGGRAGMEKAPGLDSAQDHALSAPEAPAPTGVFQSKTEDLTLPDDEYTSKNFKNGKSGRYMRQMARQGRTLGKQLLRQTGMPISF